MLKFVSVISFWLLSTFAYAENKIDIITKLNTASTSGQILYEYITLLNKSQSLIEYRIVSIPGGEGEASYARALQQNLQTKNVILNATQSTFTEHKFSGVAERHKQFLFLNTVSESISAFIINTENSSNTLDEFAEELKKKDTIFFGSTINSLPSKILNELFEKRYGLNVKTINYKNPSDLMRAILVKEIDYTIFNPTGRSSDFRLLVSAGRARLTGFEDVPTGTEIGFPEFRYSSYNLFAIPVDNRVLYDKVRLSFIEVCKSSEYASYMLKRKRIVSCLEHNEIVDVIKRELDFSPK